MPYPSFSLSLMPLFNIFTFKIRKIKCQYVKQIFWIKRFTKMVGQYFQTRTWLLIMVMLLCKLMMALAQVYFRYKKFMFCSDQLSLQQKIKFDSFFLSQLIILLFLMFLFLSSSHFFPSLSSRLCSFSLSDLRLVLNFPLFPHH